MAEVAVIPVGSDLQGDFDAVVVVVSSAEGAPTPFQASVQAAAARDAAVGKQVVLLLESAAAGGRLVVAPTGPLTRDQDDVRRVADAAAAGVRRAREAGARRPLLLLGTLSVAFPDAAAVAVLGALGALWEPLEAREALGEAEVEPIEALGAPVDAATARWLMAVEAGRRVARDLCGTEPERMTPIAMAHLCEVSLDRTGVRVEVIDDLALLQREYPLLMAVARASLPVPRHHPRVIRLEYIGEGPITETFAFAGKGLSYDTGGADLKAGGHMAGMSRDKGGAAAVLGLFVAAARLRPPGVRLIAEIGAVRNSIGAEAFVSDEIIRSHAGVRVRIGNTDAEGRLVLADCLSHLRATILNDGSAPRPHLFTVATLTGHSGRAVGPYAIALDNGPARAQDMARSLEVVGDRWGDPFEVSRLRREDFDFVRPRSRADDVLSCNSLPSTMTARGHQFPMAFLILAAGLSPHGQDGAFPLPFTHIDIGGSATEGGDWQHGRPTASPVLALIARLLGTPPA